MKRYLLAGTSALALLAAAADADATTFNYRKDLDFHGSDDRDLRHHRRRRPGRVGY